MAAIFAAAYDSLPSLPDARDAMIEKKGRDFIDGPLRKFFYEQGVQDKLGVRLLHRHFDMNPNERLVEVRKTSFPIQVGASAEPVIPWHAGNIVPQTYRFVGNSLVPCEFAWEEGQYPTGDLGLGEQFTGQLNQLLEEHDMKDLLGVCRRTPEDTSHLSMEVTHGRVNVMVPQEEAAPEHVEAFWAYNQDGLEKAACVVVCYSGAGGSHDSMHAN
ncbi:hypothetical protein FQN54_003387 [Arachnomyces sp. PD_36]|nr:hypothetical protein FQN54_003387 [Arachnomyces sp. PD_36]